MTHERASHKTIREPKLDFAPLLPGHTAFAPRGLRGTLAGSMMIHAIIASGVLLVPLVVADNLPLPTTTARAFFVSPTEPPPPPPAAAQTAARHVVKHKPETNDLVAPVEVPEDLPIEADPGLDLADLGLDSGVAGGVEGGIEGGVMGGVVGGVLGELPPDPPPVTPIRVGGDVKEPKRIRTVTPVFPIVAQAARASGLVILEIEVDAGGRVSQVAVLRGAPLFDKAAIEAVRQWRYQPLLLNGEPRSFLVTVTVRFDLTD